MTKEELSLLLYFEAMVVDDYGRIDERKINAEDRIIAKRWNEEGFIEFGRIAGAPFPHKSEYVRLSPKAWCAAHNERQLRAARMWHNARKWKTAAEARNDS